MLKDRVNSFLTELGLPVTRFARCVDLSAESIRKWLSDELVFKQSTEDRIDRFLKSFNR